MGMGFRMFGLVPIDYIFVGFGLTGMLRSTITLPNIGDPLPSHRVVLQVAGGPLAATIFECHTSQLRG